MASSSPMDWTPTDLNAVDRGTKRTHTEMEYLSDLLPRTRAFNPYPGRYMPGGWPESPQADQIYGRSSDGLVSQAISVTPNTSRRGIAGPQSLGDPMDLPQSHNLWRAAKRVCLGIQTRLAKKETQIPRTRSEPKPMTPQTPNTIHSDTITTNSAQRLSPVQPYAVKNEMRCANTRLKSKLGLIAAVPKQNVSSTNWPKTSKTRTLGAPSSRIASPNSQTLTPEPEPEATPQTPHSRVARPYPQLPTPEAEAIPRASYTRVATPCSQTLTPDPETSHLFFRPANKMFLQSPFPELQPSLEFRPPFKFGRTPSPERMVVPTNTPEHHRFLLPAELSSPFGPENTIPQSFISAQPQTPVRTSPSAQLFADMATAARQPSPPVALSTPDPYPGSAASTPRSSEMMAKQDMRYNTRALAKQKEALAKEMNGYSIIPLSKEWETKVEDALKNGHGTYTTHDLIKVVPAAGSKPTSQWLNDETINGYLKLITNLGNKSQKSGVTPKYHAFTSFFMTNLLQKGYDGVARWAKRAKIGGKLLKDVHEIFMPVNRNSHWTMLVVSPKNKTARYYDSLGYPGCGSHYVAAAKQWLKSELGAEFIEAEWTWEEFSDSPRQNNGSDCGVFAVTSAKQIMLGRSVMDYGPDQIPTQRRRLVAELIAGKLL